MYPLKETNINNKIQKKTTDSVKILKNEQKTGISGTYSVAKLSTQLLNDESKTARDLVEHGVAESPVWLRRDLLLRVPRCHFQLHQRVEVIGVFQDRTQAPHSSPRIGFCSPFGNRSKTGEKAKKTHWDDEAQAKDRCHAVCLCIRVFVGGNKSSFVRSALASEMVWRERVRNRKSR